MAMRLMLLEAIGGDRVSRRYRLRPRIDYDDLTDWEFRRLFRLSKNLFRWICDELRADLDPKRRAVHNLSGVCVCVCVCVINNYNIFVYCRLNTYIQGVSKLYAQI